MGQQSQACRAPEVLETDIARSLWLSRYRRNTADGRPEADIRASWSRVARAVAAAESDSVEAHGSRFLSILEDFRFLPGGRILAGAGTDLNVTLFNCFAMGVIEDSMDGIFSALREGALTMHAGGGIGYDFSSLRPKGMVAGSSGSIASGPVSFMRIWNTMCDTLLSTGARRGAMIASLRCDHPDIEDFITAKQDNRDLDHFNLSVQVTDDFMAAVQADLPWPLVFPLGSMEAQGEGTVLRQWPGCQSATPCRVVRSVSARQLWQRIMRCAYDSAEPGVLFTDRINAQNNLWYRETISTTNPCGEIPLPPYGACNLGSINLTRFVQAPFTPQAHLDSEAVANTAAIATRLLDNVIDISRFPLPAQAQQARGTRRIGLGITGLADALVMLGLHYDSEPARELAGHIMQTVCHSAYRASIALAREKGPFPYFQAQPYLESGFARSLPTDIRTDIARQGIRNSHLTAIAPCGTISLLAGNVSSGIEPVFDWRVHRRVLEKDGSYRETLLEDYAYHCWRRLQPQVQAHDKTLEQAVGKTKDALPAAFVTTQTLTPRAHVRMQAVLQAHVDNAISKTVNVPVDYPFSTFAELYRLAYELGLKGCTAFRPNPVTGAILSTTDASEEQVHCCNLEREGD
ncbi:MAG: hypothetical protein RLZZ385_646 [Pseudomonadota bacterium]